MLTKQYLWFVVLIKSHYLIVRLCPCCVDVDMKNIINRVKTKYNKDIKFQNLDNLLNVINVGNDVIRNAYVQRHVLIL